MEAEVQLTVEAYEANIAQARADERAKMIEAGWVKLDNNQTLPVVDPHNYDDPFDVRQGMDILVNKGWRKLRGSSLILEGEE